MLKSIITNELDLCYFTKSPRVERHHIFAGANKKNSDQYGLIIPLDYRLHPNGANFDEDYCKLRLGKNRKELDLFIKALAQYHFEQEFGSTNDFLNIFGKMYINDEERLKIKEYLRKRKYFI